MTKTFYGLKNKKTGELLKIGVSTTFDSSIDTYVPTYWFEEDGDSLWLMDTKEAVIKAQLNPATFSLDSSYSNPQTAVPLENYEVAEITLTY